jgi:hypothetical protein
MYVFFYGFWDGFIENTDPNKSFIFINMLKNIFNDDILIGDLNNADILVESVFSENTYLFYKKWKYSFFFNGESKDYLIKKKYKRFAYISNYDCILSGRITDLNKKIINFPLFVYYIYSNNYLNKLTNKKIITKIPKKNICAVISNGDCLDRNYILDKINEKIKIDYAGKFRNNILKIEGNYNSDNIFKFYSNYKFIICFENTIQETYITEKIINGFLSYSIPIYWGTNKIFDYFNKDRFIYIGNNIDNNLINNVINNINDIINDDNKYLDIVNRPILKKNKLYRTISNIENEIKNLLNK